MKNAAAFFAAIRSSLFGNRLTAAQVDGINAILYEWQHSGSGDDRQLAYVLATAYHETGQTMQPVREAFGKSHTDTIGRLNAAWKAGKLGQVSKPYWRDGYYGRGFVQLTHVENYAKMGKRLKLSLVGSPDWALRADIAAQILIVGMIEGLFTGKALSDYIGRTRCDYVNARRIVNGVDRAAIIAGYARKFESAIRAAGGVAEGNYVPPPSDVEPIPDTPSTGRDRGWGPAIGTGVAGAIALWLSESGPVLVFALVVIAGAGVALWKRDAIKAWWKRRK